MKKCGIEGCGQDVYAKGLCNQHYQRVRRYGSAGPRLDKGCSVEDCSGAHYSKGYCRVHYQRAKANGHPGEAALRRAANGAGSVEPSGYRRVTQNGRRVREHVAVAEKALGKPLPRHAVVHHIDGNRQNNAPSNLVICPSHAYHAELHARMRAAGWKTEGD